MKKRAFKAALLFVEVTALIVAVFAAVAAVAYVRLQQGPLSLGVFKLSAAFAVESRLPRGYDAQMDGLALVQRNDRFLIQFQALKIYNEENEFIAGAETIDVLFAAHDMFSRNFGPQAVEATGAKFRIVRNAEQKLKIPATRGRRMFENSETLFDRGLMREAFERAEMRDAEITFLDVSSGRSWISENATVLLQKTGTGLSGAVTGAVDLGEGSAEINADATYDQESGVINVTIAGENFPIGDILTTFYGDSASVIEAPVSGIASVELNRDGDVRASAFSARIGKGVLTLAGVNAPINFVEWETGFDPESNRFSIDRFAYDVAGNSGDATGHVSLVFGNDVRDPRQVRFDLQAADLVVTVDKRLPEPLQIEQAEVRGVYEVVDRKLGFEEFSLGFLDVSVEGEFGFTAPRIGPDGERPSPGVTANIALDGELSPERLLRIWPLGVAMGARDWVEDRMAAATIDNIRAVMDLPSGAVNADGLMPDETLTVTFDVRDAKAFYVKEMTPITDASGSGILRGNSFRLKADRARVGKVAISEGDVAFPLFIPKWEPTYYRFTATGQSEDMLAILDEAPLNLLSKINLQPDQFKGKAEARVEIMRPNKRDVEPEEYEYRGEASFEAMTISGFAGDVDLENAKGSVSLKPRSLTVTADASLVEAPIDIVWTKNFFASDGPSLLSFSGVLDASVADLFGLSLRQYVRGEVAATAKMVGEIDNFEKLTIGADFKNAALSLDLLGWEKPAGAPARGDIEMSFEGARFDMNRISIEGDGVSVNGALGFYDGALDVASFPMFQLDDAADVSIAAVRQKGGALDITLTGAHLNAGPSILHYTKGAGSPGANKDRDLWGEGLALTVRLDSLELRKGVVYQDASLDLWRNERSLQALNFTALNQGGSPLRVNMVQTGESAGPKRRIEARTSDLGDFLKGVTGLISLEGGQGSMAFDFDDDNDNAITGEIEARGLHVINAPLLARLFSVGSLDGLSNLLQGEGIDLSYAYGNFSYRENVLSLSEFRATGPSVGITTQGDVSFAPEGQLALSGAVAPVYQLNSALGAAPIIGDILVGKEGEGIVALSYSVNGERAAPNIFVNPLSALTPGVFRQLFQPVRPELETPAPAPTGDAIELEE